jgi:hypothetical protein
VEHFSAGFIADSEGQLNASANSMEFITIPFTLKQCANNNIINIKIIKAFD